MADVVEDGEVGFAEGLPWLPSHVLDEAIWDRGTKENYVKRPEHHNEYRNLPKLSPEPQHQPLRSPIRGKHPNNWASRDHGMQAVFLDSGEKSCGTGVFFPQGTGTNSHSSKKPACSPVFLPARVVKALNLNIHELGLQISRRQDAKNKSRCADCNSVKRKNEEDVLAQWNETSSPEIFLPKEWTY